MLLLLHHNLWSLPLQSKEGLCLQNSVLSFVLIFLRIIKSKLIKHWFLSLCNMLFRIKVFVISGVSIIQIHFLRLRFLFIWRLFQYLLDFRFITAILLNINNRMIHWWTIIDLDIVIINAYLLNMSGPLLWHFNAHQAIDLMIELCGAGASSCRKEIIFIFVLRLLILLRGTTE